MNVAIMGAGLSGLSCAIVLERYGIEPTIFEDRSQVGDRFVTGEIDMEILHRPVMDMLRFFSKEHGIYLQPVANLAKLVVFSENRRCDFQGHIGFSATRGRHHQSWEAQLARQVRAPIRFHSKHTYQDLLQEFTHVVLATGDSEYAARLKNFRIDFRVAMKGATIRGRFDPQIVCAWLDNRIAPKGYAYLIPYSEEEACCAIAYPEPPVNQPADLPGNPPAHLQAEASNGLTDKSPRPIDVFWSRFLARYARDIGEPHDIHHTWDISGYPIGRCYYPRIGNTYFVGNCFGAVMPFLGFGQYYAILTGVHAAYDLLGMGDYAEKAAQYLTCYEESLVIRRAMEHVSNRGFDRLLWFLDGSVGNWLFDTPRDVLGTAAQVMRPFISLL
ncbi:fad-dependent dehydrogenase, putative [Heliomicrobium modesticaldum Ice1]|uniref:Fad-dependent dehydrogenase, putative n=1 Tax=Heliobacterium modesticaldum (strain ATCC 51547 / Ice1) TaxID=498761 RepID=B0TAR4_HELMI|nr:NAD-binding protein [Heliomicrobium modesticaldum]ABZ83716.1 fad-dependent dehydrogenase, putative [Heliomicrobium modesticaldum Ice1]